MWFSDAARMTDEQEKDGMKEIDLAKMQIAKY